MAEIPPGKVLNRLRRFVTAPHCIRPGSSIHGNRALIGAYLRYRVATRRRNYRVNFFGVIQTQGLVEIPLWDTPARGDCADARLRRDDPQGAKNSPDVEWARAANFREGPIEDKMSGKVGGGPQIAFHDLALEIGNHQVLWFHLLVRDSAGFDDNQVPVARDTAGIAEGIKYRHARNLSQFSLGRRPKIRV
jgi:hypothetical protein